MGSTICSADQPITHQVFIKFYDLKYFQVTQFPSYPPLQQSSSQKNSNSNWKLFKKSTTLSIRFGQIQKVKSQKYPFYKLILPLSHSIQIISLQCPILANYSDLQMYQINNYNNQNTNVFNISFVSENDAPIIDIFDKQDRYIFHKVQILKNKAEVISNNNNLKNIENGKSQQSIRMNSSRNTIINSQYHLNPFQNKQKNRLTVQNFVENRHTTTGTTNMQNRKTIMNQSRKTNPSEIPFQQIINPNTNSSNFNTNQSVVVPKNPAVRHIFNQKKLIKVYPFETYRDSILTNALYQIYIYKTLSQSNNTYNTSPLKDFFIIERGKPFSIVMIFQNYRCSLFDILMYRKLANAHWNKIELVYIVQQLLNGYRELSMNNIAHRDIRASKIFLKDRIFDKGLNNNQMNYKKRDEYSYVDLSSARKLTRSDLKDKHNLLMTVKGVGFFSDQKIKQLHLNDAQIGSYNYQMTDRTALTRLIVSLIKLQPYQISLNAPKQFEKMNQICQMLLNQNYDIQSIIHKFQESLVKQYKNKQDYGNLQNDINFSDLLNRKLILQAQKERIKGSVIQNMFLLHLKNAFMPKLLDQINFNYKKHCQQANLPILHRLGNYYNSIGVKNNDYFREEIQLLCQLGQKQRIHGFFDRENSYVQRAEQIQLQLTEKMKTSAILTSLFTEKSMNQLYHKNSTQKALEYINQAMLIGGNDNAVPISTQLKVIQAKGLIQNSVNNDRQNQQLFSEYFEKGLQLSSQKSNFSSKTQHKQFLSTFQYRMAEDLLSKLKKNKSDSRVFNKRNIAKCQSFLKSAIQNRQGLQSQTIHLALCLQCLGDLNNLIQQHQQSKQNFKRADVLMRTSQPQRQVHPNIQLRVLKKIKQQCQLLNQDDQVHQIQTRIRIVQKLKDNSNKKSQKRRMMRFGNDKRKKQDFSSGSNNYQFGQDFRQKKSNNNAIQEVSQQQQEVQYDNHHQN